MNATLHVPLMSEVESNGIFYYMDGHFNEMIPNSLNKLYIRLNLRPNSVSEMFQLTMLIVFLIFPPRDSKQHQFATMITKSSPGQLKLRR